MFDAFATLISRLSQHQLTWFVIEDLHWSDTSSRDLLSYVVRSLDLDAHLLTVCTFRTQDTSPHGSAASFVDELSRLPHARTVGLRRLHRAQVADLLGELVPETPAAAFLNRVVELSDGIPFLVEELAAGADGHGQIPESVATTMLRRVQSLQRDTRTLVRIASLDESHLQHDRLARVCHLGDERMAAALSEAVSTNILELDADGTGYRFHHALMREAVAHSLLPADRVSWHRRWAELLDSESNGDQPLTAIASAHHWAQTQDESRAFDAACRAAEVAEAFGAASERAALLSRMLDLWSRVPGAERRAGQERDTVLLNILSARGSSGFADDLEAAASLLEAELAREDAHESLRALWLRLELADCHENQKSGTAEAFFGPGSTTLSRLEDAPRNSTFVRAVGALVQRSLTERAEGSVIDLVDEALQVANDVPEPLEEHVLRRGQVHLLEALGRAEEAVEQSAALARWANQQRSLAEVSITESNHAFQLTVVGRFAEAADLTRRTLARLDKPTLSPWAWAFVVENSGRALAELGQWDTAEEQLRTALALGIGGEHRVFLEVEAGLIRCHRGDIDSAEGYLRSARSRLPKSPSKWRTAAFAVRWLAAEIATFRGDVASARAELDQTLRHSEAIGMPLGWRIVLIAVRIEADAARAASPTRRRALDNPQDRMAEILSYADALPDAGDLGVAWRRQLEVETKRAAGTDRAADWKNVVEGWHRTGQVHDEAWAMVHQARCELEAGRKDHAERCLSRAIAIGVRLDARPLIDAAHEVAGRGRIALDAAGHTEQTHRAKRGLTRRELEVLRLVADGNRNDEIGKALFISPSTASVHISHILAKLGVATRTEATAVAHRERLLDDA